MKSRRTGAPPPTIESISLALREDALPRYNRKHHHASPQLAVALSYPPHPIHFQYFVNKSDSKFCFRTQGDKIWPRVSKSPLSPAAHTNPTIPFSIRIFTEKTQLWFHPPHQTESGDRKKESGCTGPLQSDLQGRAGRAIKKMPTSHPTLGFYLWDYVCL